ncbi:DMT family transporter [Salinarimonas soli]|uniref:DMT family transporter n=1 Tax=Salinarimonas soli TaxID=1638099 RepID=A0A5B2VF33_9HYPH|nr:DMT family transporter [Salinarimonas soli]KAA2236992.1 DMT family transporter [Salinarimonas soli]
MNGLLATRRGAITAMLLAVVIYGGNFVVTRHATLNGLSPNDLAALRFGVGGLLLLPVFLRAGAATCAGVGWGRGLVLAAMSGLPMVLLMNTGLSLAPAAHGAAIQPGTVTVIGAVGSIVMFGVRPPRIVAAGILTVLAGLACIGIAGGTSGSRSIVTGDLCFLAAGALWGLYPLLLQRWQVGAIVSTSIVAVLSMAYLPVYLLGSPGIMRVDALVVAFHAVNQGLLNMILGLWLWGSAVRTLGAAEAQRFPPLIPVVGTLLAIPLLGEWPAPVQAVGVALIVGGLAIASAGPFFAARRVATRS